MQRDELTTNKNKSNQTINHAKNNHKKRGWEKGAGQTKSYESRTLGF